MKNLIKAVTKVMTEVKGMEKNSTVGSGRAQYNGTKDADVKEVFNDALAKNGLCMIPFDIDESTQVDRWTEDTQYGPKQKQSIFTKVVVKYNLMHESGESTVVCGYGHGVDPQDKAAGKATTYAMKNALLYTFLTPVGKIDDTETVHSNEIATPAKMPRTKPVMNAAHPNWDKCVKHLQGAGKLSDLEKKYTISKDVADKLMAQALM